VGFESPVKLVHNDLLPMLLPLLLVLSLPFFLPNVNSILSARMHFLVHFPL